MVAFSGLAHAALIAMAWQAAGPRMAAPSPRVALRWVQAVVTRSLEHDQPRPAPPPAVPVHAERHKATAAASVDVAPVTPVAAAAVDGAPVAAVPVEVAPIAPVAAAPIAPVAAAPIAAVAAAASEPVVGIAFAMPRIGLPGASPAHWVNRPVAPADSSPSPAALVAQMMQAQAAREASDTQRRAMALHE
jgi:hypothetical protein